MARKEQLIQITIQEIQIQANQKVMLMPYFQNKTHNEMQGKKEENKMQEISNFQNKDSCKFFKVNQLVKMLIINGDQIL